MENNLRDRVLLRVDGGLKSGWDIIVATLMGAEEYGFGSIAMIAEGCIMAQICHTNKCPVGVASQREDLRARFPGIPEQVVNFFYFIAEEVRGILARLGYRSLNDLIGRADLFTMRPEAKLTKVQSINLDCLTQLPDTKIDPSERESLVRSPLNTATVPLKDNSPSTSRAQPDKVSAHSTMKESA
jgi:glutamate synthase (ferredoxin)